MDFTALTQQLIRAYLGDDVQSTRQVMEMVAEDIIVIGTGRQEIFRSRKEYMAALERELVERHGMHFEVLSLECAVHPITPEAVLVTGPLIIYGSGAEAEGEPMGVYMETRYSMVYRKEADGWKVAHLHHSVPNTEQSDQETYPKTLLRQVEEARRLAQRDPLTDLLNLRAFQEQYRRMAPEDAWLYIIDIDHFKQTNDAFGHLVGNQVLRELAAMMVSSVRATDVVCRMGGDEFLILCTGMRGPEEAGALARRLLEGADKMRRDTGHLESLSIGISHITPGIGLKEAAKKADQALYQSKAAGRNRYTIAR